MTIEDRIRKQLAENPVILFMKGTPEFPQCGFSGQAVQVLNACQCKYSYFNVFDDEEIRQGLKEFSEWPTYPQLYIKGELIGGADIIAQIYNDGSLKRMLSDAEHCTE